MEQKKDGSERSSEDWHGRPTNFSHLVRQLKMNLVMF